MFPFLKGVESVLAPETGTEAQSSAATSDEPEA